MRYGISLLVIVGIIVMAPALCFAGKKNPNASPWTNGTNWTERTEGKLIFGLQNVLLGWTEILTEPDEVLGTGKSVLGGFWRGAVNAVGQTLGGALQVLTFPITSFDIPLPEGGVAWDRSYLEQ